MGRISKKHIVLNTNYDIREKWDEFVKSILCSIPTVIPGKSGTNCKKHIVLNTNCDIRKKKDEFVNAYCAQYQL